MQVITTLSSMQSISRDIHKSSLRTGFVPTMGFLHEGHLSLIRLAREETDVVVVSIFVNPTQFGANEDLDCYPRDLEHDKALCESCGVDYLFCPAVAEIYSSDSSVFVDENEVSTGLCGASREGHFSGVLTVVAKLFNMVMPDIAVFGQKDAQQVAVIKRMVRDLNFPLEILVGPIVREPDGLAMSSRNTFLSDDDRTQALWLNKALLLAETMVKDGVTESAALESAMRKLIAENACDMNVEYIAIVDSTSMKPVDRTGSGTLVALAARVGKTRLIDNRIML